jgi:streptomycin 6-kinase
LDDCAQRWKLTFEPHFTPLNYTFVARVICADGRHGVLKAGVPGTERDHEEASLRVFGGRSSVALLKAKSAWGVLLLERLRPGRMLEEVADDDAATSIAAGVMSALWRPVSTNHTFPTVADCGNDFVRLCTTVDGATGPFKANLVEQAERLFADLLASSSAPMLLHGDQHQPEPSFGRTCTLASA